MLALARSFHYPPGKPIFQQGDPSVFLFVVKSGHVALETTLPSDGALTLLAVERGKIFSWSALSETRIETASARAIDDLEVLGFEGVALQDLCREDPQVGVEIYRILAEVLSSRLAAARQQITEMLAPRTPSAPSKSG
jgi:CRP-like cAMP-binding protein